MALNTHLAARIRDTGLAQIAEQRDVAQTVEALLMGTLALARCYMTAPEVADYLRAVANNLEQAAKEDKQCH